MIEKKLYKSKENKKIDGVCGGIGIYLDIDPTVIRLIWIILTFLTGVIPGIIIYILAAIIIPRK